jgi:F-type H+-transporting ATPase subunit c
MMIAQTVTESIQGLGNINVACAALGAALSVGFIGAKAVEAVGRNPGAFPKVLTMAILSMALAEAIVFYALFLKAVS